MKAQKLIIPFMIALFAISSTSFAHETRWERNHPRRDQVNDRLHRQDARINHEYRTGEISRRQAANLHRDDRRIRNEERVIASRNGGNITKREEIRLNHQENRVGRRIK